MVDWDALRAVTLWIDAGSGLLFVALGVAVALIRPRRAVNVAFSVFGVAFGAIMIIFNLVGGPPPLAVRAANLGLTTAAVVALGALAATFPGPIPQPRRRVVLPAVALVVVATATAAVSTRIWHFEPVMAAAAGAVVVNAALLATYGAFLLVLALRFATASGPAEARVRDQTWFASAALLPYLAVVAGLGPLEMAWRLEDFGVRSPGSVAALVAVAVVSAAWLRAAARADDARDRRRARALGLLGPAVGCLAALVGAAIGPGPVMDAGPAGITRGVGVAVLAYAILRHQLFDIDVKIKWTLRQSTVAAIFVAVFFVASEAAQAFFAETVGPYVGIAAAGALVFVIAPLQRAAERLSDRAMPNVRTDGAWLEARKRETYRNALAVAWQDGALTAKERRLLLDLRETLGLAPQDYDALEREFEPGPSA